MKNHQNSFLKAEAKLFKRKYRISLYFNIFSDVINFEDLLLKADLL